MVAKGYDKKALTRLLDTYIKQYGDLMGLRSEKPEACHVVIQVKSFHGLGAWFMHFPIEHIGHVDGAARIKISLEHFKNYLQSEIERVEGLLQ